MKRLASALIVLGLAVLPTAVFAQNYTGELDSAGIAVYGTTDSGGADFYTILSLVLEIILSILGLILLLYILYGGYTWMTAAGNTEQAKKAQATIQNAVIGMIVLICAYAITQYVTGLVSSAV